MELPICKSTYSNEIDIDDAEFLKECYWAFAKNVESYRGGCRYLFPGLCFYCHTASTITVPRSIQRCGGCQLVAYCSKDCQKNDRYIHKFVCKEFPVVNGKNVLCTTGHWKEHIAALRERAARLPHAEVAASPLFRNPRVCRTCKEARQILLTDCICGCVSYCSHRCTVADKHHEEDCGKLAHIVQQYSRLFMENRPNLRYNSVFEKFTPASEWTDIIPSHYHPQLQAIQSRERGTSVGMEAYLTVERLSYPMTLLYALQALPERRLGHDSLPLEDMTTINLHIVTSNPLLDSEPWEMLMHRLPKLKQLNVVFVIEGKTLNQSHYLNASLKLLRCNDCKAKNRVITYSVHQMQYHMYFSSQEYTEPDVVVVFGNKQEMTAKTEDDINNEISYRNMTYNPDTVLVLTDTTKNLVLQGVRDVNAARPVDQIVSIRINPLRGYSSNRAELDSDTAVINEKHYFTCLRR